MKRLVSNIAALLVLGLVGLLFGAGTATQARAQALVDFPCNPPYFLNTGFAGQYEAISAFGGFDRLVYTPDSSHPWLTTVTVLSVLGEAYVSEPVLVYPWQKDFKARLRSTLGSAYVGEVKVCSGFNFGIVSNNAPRLAVRATVFGSQIVPAIPSDCSGDFTRCFRQFNKVRK